ncbi:LCP family protein [Streptomyces sp. NPDC088725]|uniref:LCP family protein n=1 Tax=Streptomyces sp. NPDC088725 TaxID=3365873 RepID=UPI0038237D6D
MTDDSGIRRPRGSGGNRETPSRRRRVIKVVVWSLVGLVVVVGGGLTVLYFKLNGNINGVDINAQLGTERPRNVENGSQDILVLGSDSRAGANAEYGGNRGARSDTAMVLHVYPGHKKASVVSVPRDTLVARPRCAALPGKKAAPAMAEAMFNSAYEVGGPACAVKTVEKMSGIRMDHYIEVDFTGFKKLVNELGGVKITTLKPIRDPKSHLTLPKGTHTLRGEQALGLVRTRETIGDGSDLGRIELQQAFMRALIKQVRSVGVFSSPKKLYDLADTATQTITPDSQLDSINELIGFAGGLKNLSAGDVKMITLPVRYDPADPNRVLPMRKASRQVWKALRQDRPIPASATRHSAGDQGDAGDVVKSG